MQDQNVREGNYILVSPISLNTEEEGMSDQEIRSAQEQLISTFDEDADAALGTVTAEASISNGLACRVSEGDHVTEVDMPVAFGGTATGPSPGFHARAAVASCVAIGIKSAAVRAGLNLETVNVRIEMDFDDSAIFHMGKNTAAPTATRLLVTIKSEHSDEELKSLVDDALEADPYFLALRDAQKVATTIATV